MMSIDEYQRRSLRTLNTEGKSQEQIISGLLLGIHGESGEISDIFKKHYNQGHGLDLDHVVEEIGDTMFYMVNLCNILEINMNDVLQQNIDKLLRRYPDGFESERSTNRD